MFYKPNYGAENQFVVAPEKLDDEFQEMDDSLFAEGFDGGVYLKSFLANPSAEYLLRKKQMKINSEIFSLKTYLNDTDYVITKLNELKLEDDDEYKTACQEYSEVLTKRKETRKKINELEAENSDNE